MTSDRFTSRDAAIAGGVFALALFVRLIFLFSTSDRTWPHSIWYEGDATLWVEYATALDRGEPFWFGLPFHPPGVAYPLHWLVDDVGQANNFCGVKVLWCIMSAATCALLYLCCVPSMGRRVALIASGLCAFSFGQYVLATSLNSEAPYTTLLCLMVLLTQTALRSASWRMIIVGVLHGLATLLRPEHPLLVLFWCVWVVGKWPIEASITRQTMIPRAAVAGAMVAAMLLTCLPWSAKAWLNTKAFNQAALEDAAIDYQASRVPWSADARAAFDELPTFAQHSNFKYLIHVTLQRGDREITAQTVDRFFAEEFGYKPEPVSPWVLVSNQGPLSLALANHPSSDGGFSRAALEHPKLESNPTFNVTFPPHLQLLNDGHEVAWSYVASDFGSWLTLVVKKLRRFVDGAAIGFTAGNLPLGREGVRHPVDLMTANDGIAGTLWTLAMLGLLAAGVAASLARRRGGIWLAIIASKLIVTILFYGYARQAASIGPAFFVLIALACDFALPRDHRWPVRVGIGAVIAAVVIDIGVAALAPRLIVQPEQPGTITARPQWGAGAFQSFGRVHITAARSSPLVEGEP